MNVTFLWWTGWFLFRIYFIWYDIPIERYHPKIHMWRRDKNISKSNKENNDVTTFRCYNHENVIQYTSLCRLNNMGVWHAFRYIRYRWIQYRILGLSSVSLLRLRWYKTYCQVQLLSVITMESEYTCTIIHTAYSKCGHYGREPLILVVRALQKQTSTHMSTPISKMISMLNSNIDNQWWS